MIAEDGASTEEEPSPELGKVHTAYALVLVALPDPAAKIDPKYERDGGYRLKLLLKHALRTWGFKCVSVTDPPKRAAH